MSLQTTRPFVWSSFALALGLFLLPCGARTGLNFPDTRPLAPPLCSQPPLSVQVSLIVDPGIPSVHASSVNRVDWSLTRRCATNIPQDPAQGIGGRLSSGCSITQYVNGTTETMHDCTAPPGSGTAPPANFHLGPSSNRVDNLGFVFITNPGNICISGRVYFSDGTPPVDIPQRMWRTPIPAVYTLGNAPSDPTIGVGGFSAPGCPNT